MGLEHKRYSKQSFIEYDWSNEQPVRADREERPSSRLETMRSKEGIEEGKVQAHKEKK